MDILAVYNLKGGVGKTSTAVNLAYLASQDGYRTLLWDMDPQGASTFYCRIKPKVKGGVQKIVKSKHNLDPAIRGTDFDNLDLLPADFSYRTFDSTLNATKNPVQRLATLIRPLRKEYDLLFFDCPDGLATLTESIFFASDLLLIPTIPTTLSLRTLDQVQKHIKKQTKKPPKIMPFLSMVDRRKRLHKDVCAEYADGKDGFLKATIPYASAIERMGIERAPLPSYDRRSRATLAFRDLWAEVKGAL